MSAPSEFEIGEHGSDGEDNAKEITSMLDIPTLSNADIAFLVDKTSRFVSFEDDFFFLGFVSFEPFGRPRARRLPPISEFLPLLLHSSFALFTALERSSYTWEKTILF